MAREPAIHLRIRAALAKATAPGINVGVRAIYLTQADQDELDKAATKAWGSCPVFRTSFDDIHIRRGDRSMVALKSGQCFAIPRRLP
jgi:hypothetical protein